MRELYPNLLNPSRWSLVRLYRLPAGLGREPVRASVRDLWRRHDALRVHVRHTTDGWRQRVADPATPEPFRAVDLTRVPPDERRTEIERLAVEAHSTLNLEAGPVARFLHLYLGDDEPGRLLVLVHHFAADGLSFARIQSDLDTLLAAHATGGQTRMPRGAAYRDCVEAMVDYSRSADLRRELDHWRAQPWQDCADLPTDYPAHTADTPRSWTTLQVRLGGADAHALAQRLPAALGVDLDDIVLAAVAETLTTWSGGALCLQNVHHGRTLKRDPDARVPVLPPRAQRTVGWFSVHGCLVVPPRTEGDPADYLRRVRQCATAPPNRGAGITPLRWTTPVGEHTELLTQAWRSAQILYNFGGLGGRLDADRVLGVADEATGHRADPLEPHRQLHVRASYGGDDLTMNWDYDARLRSPQTIAKLADQCHERLTSYLRAAG